MNGAAFHWAAPRRPAQVFTSRITWSHAAWKIKRIDAHSLPVENFTLKNGFEFRREAKGCCMKKLDRHDQGVICVLLSMALFAAYDTGSKLISASVPLVLILWVRYAIQMIWMGLNHQRHVQGKVWQTRRPVLHVCRALILLCCNAFSVLIFKYLPVGEVTAIVMLMPVLMTVFAAKSLDEPVDRLQWGLLALGLAGVLCVVRPGLRPWDAAILLPIGFLLTYTAFQAVTGVIVKTESTDSVFFYTSVTGFTALSLLLPMVWAGWPAFPWGALIILIATCSAVGHQLLVLAYSRTMASALTPFLYCQLVFAALGGWLAFGEIPDKPAVWGGLLIMGSGVWSALRKRGAAGQDTQVQARVLAPRKAA
ncbi:DMT family transporter [Azohydromonas lata]|uniref:DMT family transporter n=1 Tax=Azohydromonas lata TaxID=45677 RepID=A0ABU5IEF4_9BURK|nr:DMT family transporter [Azohydromonas lata]MDZ5457495.1 DMT family transporter [Azohydromonas lata]